MKRRPPFAAIPTARRKNRRRSTLRRGVATVEFAFSVSIVFMLFMGMIEVTRFHVVRHSLDQAVYAGARIGIVPGATASQVEASVTARLASAGVVNPTITVTPAIINSSTMAITVQASIDCAENSWTLPRFFENQTITAEITLDHENIAFK